MRKAAARQIAVWSLCAPLGLALACGSSSKSTAQKGLASTASGTDSTTATATGTVTATGTGTGTTASTGTATGTALSTGSTSGTSTATGTDFSTTALGAIPAGVAMGAGSAANFAPTTATLTYSYCGTDSGIYPLGIKLNGPTTGAGPEYLLIDVTGSPTVGKTYPLTKTPDDVTSSLNIAVQYENATAGAAAATLTSGRIAFGQFSKTQGATVSVLFDLDFGSAGHLVGSASGTLSVSTDGGCVVADEPIIYLYPTKPTAATVQLDYSGTLTTSYPVYDSALKGWAVTAQPDGTLKNKADGKEYSYLFWEGQDKPGTTYDMSQGFVVPGKDIRPFLQEKLAALGLTPRELNEFIVYWYPKMEHNPFNLVHFATSDYTDHAKLTVTPTPDSVLRVFMVYQPLLHPAQIHEQVLTPFKRQGFAVVEWGGSELKVTHLSATKGP